MDPTLIPRPRHMIEPQFQKATADVREAQAIEILNDWGLHIIHITIYIYTHIYIYIPAEKPRKARNWCIESNGKLIID